MKIKYEPHPVTPERKAELVAQGYTIIDARFAPESVAAPEQGAEEPKPVTRRSRKAKAED